MKYRVHQFDIDMRRDRDKLEQFLNGLKNDVVSIIPNVKPIFFDIVRLVFHINLDKCKE